MDLKELILNVAGPPTLRRMVAALGLDVPDPADPRSAALAIARRCRSRNTRLLGLLEPEELAEACRWAGLDDTGEPEELAVRLVDLQRTTGTAPETGAAAKAGAVRLGREALRDYGLACQWIGVSGV